MDKLEISIVLPLLVDHPIGGFKVHYQYANALAECGHRVTIVHPITESHRAGIRDRLALRAARKLQASTGKPPISWFRFHEGIRSELIGVLSSNQLPRADVTILTAWQTAERTMNPAPHAGVLVQIVFDYEFWMTNEALRPQMAAALGRTDVHQIATSKVVAKMLREIGREPVGLIQPGLLRGEFGVDLPIEQRSEVVSFARRISPIKDVGTAVAAASELLASDANIRVECFGLSSGGALPDGIEDLGPVSNEILRSVLNRTSVFILSSRYEGWGLMAAEAMACGAAVVSTRSGGIEDFIDDGVNGLLVPVGDHAAMASAVLSLLYDDEKRIKLASAGAHDAGQMDLDNSGKRLESLIRSLVR
jgi:glycosyltransferase involved in cell wall biosynthesis